MTALFSLAALASLLIGVAILYSAMPRGVALRRGRGRRWLGLGQLLVGLLWVTWGALALKGAGHLRAGAGPLGLVLGALWTAQAARRLFGRDTTPGRRA